MAREAAPQNPPRSRGHREGARLERILLRRAFQPRGHRNRRRARLPRRAASGPRLARASPRAPPPRRPPRPARLLPQSAASALKLRAGERQRGSLRLPSGGEGQRGKPRFPSLDLLSFGSLAFAAPPEAAALGAALVKI